MKVINLEMCISEVDPGKYEAIKNLRANGFEIKTVFATDTGLIMVRIHGVDWTGIDGVMYTYKKEEENG